MVRMVATKSLVFKFADIEVREREFSIVKSGQVRSVEPKAFRVLLVLLQNPQKLMTKEELLSEVWADAAVTDNSLTRAITLLRRLLGDDAREPRFIETVTTIGYRWLCPVEVSESAEKDLNERRNENSRAPNGMKAHSAETVVGALHVAGNGKLESPYAPELSPSSVGEPALTAIPLTTPAPARRSIQFTWLSVGTILAVPIAIAAWWLFSPRPQPRVTNITQITNDDTLRHFQTDGSRIYYTAITKNGLRFYERSVKGGEPVPMGQLDGMDPFDISADQSELLLQRDKDHSLWVASAEGTSLRPLTGLIVYEARWSPSGNQIAYVPYAAQKEVRIARSDGTDSRTLATVEGLAYGLSWYPDGSRLIFSVWTEDRATLWEVSANGTGLHMLFPEWSDHSQWYGSWTPDGKYLVFMALDLANYNRWDIWALRKGGGLFGSSRNTPVRLTTGPLRINRPVVSRDGKRIFFYGVLDRVELVRYDSNTKEWVPYLSGLSAEQLDFSSDGKSLAFVSFPDGNLFRSDKDGGHKLQLSPKLQAMRPFFLGFNPRFSPDGTQIAFAGSRRPNEPGRVYVESTDGSGLHTVTNGECGRDGEWNPVWSPDGASLVFGCSPGPKAGLNRDSTVLRLVDLKTGKISVLPGSQGLGSPRWSPNGRYLVALSFPLPADLVLYDLQTHVQRKLLTLKTNLSGWPAWSPDGQFVYVLNGYTESRVRISDGGVEIVADLVPAGDYPPWSGITPDGSLIATRNISTDEIYVLDWVAP